MDEQVVWGIVAFAGAAGALWLVADVCEQHRREQEVRSRPFRWGDAQRVWKDRGPETWGDHGLCIAAVAFALFAAVKFLPI